MKNFISKIKNRILPLYLILNVLYIFIGSYLYTIKKIDFKYFSYGFIVLLVINILISIIIFIKKKYKKNIIDLLLLFIIIFAFISFIFAYKRKIALFGEWGRYEGLFTICYYMSILFLSSFVKKKDKKIIIFSIIFGGLVELFYGTCQLFGLFNVKIILHYDTLFVIGFTNNPNFFGTLMLLCISFSIGLFLEEKRKFRRVNYYLLCILFLIGILFSDTLSSLVGLIFALICLLFYSIRKKIISNYILLLLTIIFVTLLMQILGLTTLVDDLIKTKNETSNIVSGDINEDYGTGRVKLYKETIKVIPKYIVHGVGIDNFAYILDGKPITRGRYLYDKAHNEYLQILVTMGIFSLISYLSLHFIIIKRCIRNSELYIILPILGYLVQAQFNISVIEVAPLFYISLGLAVNRCSSEKFYRDAVKRVLDVVLSVMIIILLSPIYLIVSLLILIIDRNKIIFKQLRTGLNGKNFYIYKFCTYKNNNVTKFGKILRSISLDELPQFFNILKGDMSFIGPRPWVVEYFENMNDYQRKRVTVLPGIIGLAQVNGRNSIDIIKKIDYDLYYIDHISFFLDLKIIFKCFKVIFIKEGNSISNSGIEREIDTLKKMNKEYN